MKGAPRARLPVLSVREICAGRPKIEATTLRLVWFADFWDGPLAGLVDHAGEMQWFNIIHPTDGDSLESRGDDGFGWPRTFGVFRLTDDQLREEQRWHALFEEKVRSGSVLQPSNKWGEFYDVASLREPLDLTHNEIVGWFETEGTI